MMPAVKSAAGINLTKKLPHAHMHARAHVTASTLPLAEKNAFGKDGRDQ